ncbi:MAG: hypothetical protein KBT70_14755 [Roseovarius sp.]|uniref:hypothetical protein n=1 Tax=Roseovarius sp. TaxID=1486281 RepID=UPI001B49A9B9|nr:hypothetical protein [Roseovarius sp.]MBQ0751452.1 hypothetical protein [Roseovarius sp.]MBQ0809557.1 hypothetical protein [Roseovarius sp.]
MCQFWVDRGRTFLDNLARSVHVENWGNVMVFYWIAALGLLFLSYIHLTAGQRKIVNPLLASRELKEDVVCVLFLCWHLVTLVMLGAAAAYIGAVISDAWREYALAGTVMISLLALWSFAVVIWKRQLHRDMPQWIAFAVVAIFGFAGHLTT